MQRWLGLSAFLVFVVLQTFAGDRLGWLIFQKLQWVAMAWQPWPFIVIEGIGVAAVIVASLACGAIERKRLGDYGFAPAGAGRQIAAGSAWGLGAVALTVGVIAVCGGFTV